MKNILLMILVIVTISCKAQTPIIDLYGNQPYGSVNNAYYKDVNGFLNQYVGTWLYSNGTTSLKIIFVKKEQKFMDGHTKNFYEDLLVGEYQYIENGIEKVNTLSQINTDFGSTSVDMEKHSIIEISCIRFPAARPKCNECSPNERRLQMSLSEPAFSNIEGLSNAFVIRKFVENGLVKLKVWFYSEIQVQPEDENGNPVNFTGFSLPFGEYTLIKQ